MINRQSIAQAAGFLLLAAVLPAISAVPTLPTANSRITLDGVPLGSAIAIRSAAPTIQYDAPTSTYHMWVGTADSLAPGTSASDFYPLRIAGFRHASATDGVSFRSDGALSFSGMPFASTIYGSTFGEPLWVFPKASVWNGRYVLGLWTFNAFFDAGVFGDFNYHISLNDIGAAPSNRVLTHRGPVGAVPNNGIYGQTAGIFGIVNGVMYYDLNSSLGRAPLTDAGPQLFPATAATGPWQVTGSNTPVADLLTALGRIACHLPGGDAFVHNNARVLANGDGTLGIFFTLRSCDGSRMLPGRIYYAESSDNGANWGAPAAISTGAETIGGNAATTGFALSDVVNVRGQRVVYFNFFDSSGNLVVGALPPPIPTSVSVPLDSSGMLLLLAILFAFAAQRALRR